jgi:alpha-1,3-rhamnosyltransferase
VLETLESARAQTYQNIELIVSDDCSTDDTVEICRSWIEKNRERFVRVELITAPANSGISPNCNRGVKAANGEWVKLIAGDDVLWDKFLERSLPYMNNSAVNLLCAKVYFFKDDIATSIHVWPKFKFPTHAKVQLRNQLIGGFIRSPSVLIRKIVFQDLGFFDERYLFLEDDPFWVKALTEGYMFDYNPNSLVYYRVNGGSITQSKSNQVFSLKFSDSLIRYRKEIALPLLKKKKMFFWWAVVSLEVKIMKFIIVNGNTRNNIINVFLLKVTRIGAKLRQFRYAGSFNNR